MIFSAFPTSGNEVALDYDERIVVSWWYIQTTIDKPLAELFQSKEDNEFRRVGWLDVGISLIY